MKLRAEELRIGNLVYNGEAKEDTEIFLMGINHILECDRDLKPCRYWGIEITYEWLERFRFQKDGDSYNLPITNGHGVDICIEVFENEKPPFNSVLIRKHTLDGAFTDGFDYCYMSSVKYVHELQNLYYALTKKELKAVTQHTKRR